jgi:glycerol-3-phosphate dehydrogenase (NAD(P)+)
MKIAVLGAGAWGTAIACTAAARHSVALYVRDEAQRAQMARERVNARYLPEIVLPDSLALDSDFRSSVAHGAAGLIVIATPTNALREILRGVREFAPTASLVWLCKGFEESSELLAHQVVADELGAAAFERAGPLSGPSFALEVARGLPTALTVAGPSPFCGRVTDALHGGALRVYSTDDLIGVEIGGAVKNVLAIATGISDALGLGLNARAALITRGLAEMTRLGVALGARAETFMGLTGVGDLILTATGDLSRNRRVGLALGRGMSTAAAVAELGHVAEGVRSAQAVAGRARAAGVEMPISEAVCAVLAGKLSAQQALDRLLARDPKPETAA